MAKLNLTAKDLRRIGYADDAAVSTALRVMHKHYKHHKPGEAIQLLRQIITSPEAFADDEVLGEIAVHFIEVKEEEVPQQELRSKPVDIVIFGAEQVDHAAIDQLRSAARLPVAVSGALMPDAHSGYGLPIGGVLATENAVIPYGVGVDIGCRMCLTVYDLHAYELNRKQKQLETALLRHTYFGSGRELSKAHEHEVIDRPEFGELALLRKLQGKAAKQLGTSGSGNHFVEFGEVEILADWPERQLKAGRYIGLLSHSGSRGLGASVATHYTEVAKQWCRLPRQLQHLAWLPLDWFEGQAYWKAMNLAGDYAAACHEVIHQRITREINLTPLAVIENHHNFAWKEMHLGREVIVHRKGATPAAKDEAGIIPGSMTAPGFIVRGRGETSSLHSASHGAGRVMSRSRAKESITHNAMNALLQQHGVTLHGGGLDEAPQAYKNINEVMNAQQSLVDIMGTFRPRIVRMDG
ncbi:MAG: RtcB family protein [Bacteroidia bacterium]|jgi:tRNA-splicing ligase RtcB|nr:RtcB family protein [Bacteroidia bacterium]